MLADEDAAVDGYDVVLGKGFLQLTSCLLVVLWLTIGGHEDGIVDDKEIGVSGW